MSLKIIKIFVDWYNKSHYGSFANFTEAFMYFHNKKVPLITKVI